MVCPLPGPGRPGLMPMPYSKQASCWPICHIPSFLDCLLCLRHGKKCCMVSIFFNTLRVNSLICFLMYFIKAVLDHCPIIMMAKTGTPPRYIAIAAPACMEWVPTLWQWMLSLASSAAMTPSHKADSTILLVTCETRL